MTTPTAMAYRTAAPPDKAEVPVAEVPVAEALAAVVRPAVAGPAEVLAEVLAVVCPRAAVATTRGGEHPSAARAQPCTHAWFILASGSW